MRFVMLWIVLAYLLFAVEGQCALSDTKCVTTQAHKDLEEPLW